LVLIKKTQLNR